MTNKEALQALIDDSIKERVKMEFYIDFYTKEVNEHKTVGVEQARENVTLYTKHRGSLITHLRLLQAYYNKRYK